jgi:hypothetical protein
MRDSLRTAAGPAVATLAIAVGVTLVAACGSSADDNVTPPPLKRGLSSVVSVPSGSSSPAVLVPPSPTWRIADETQPKRTTTEPPTRTSTTRTTQPRPTTTEETEPETTEETTTRAVR